MALNHTDWAFKQRCKIEATFVGHRLECEKQLLTVLKSFICKKLMNAANNINWSSYRKYAFGPCNIHFSSFTLSKLTKSTEVAQKEKKTQLPVSLCHLIT